MNTTVKVILISAIVLSSFGAMAFVASILLWTFGVECSDIWHSVISLAIWSAIVVSLVYFYGWLLHKPNTKGQE